MGVGKGYCSLVQAGESGCIAPIDESVKWQPWLRSQQSSGRRRMTSTVEGGGCCTAPRRVLCRVEQRAQDGSAHRHSTGQHRRTHFAGCGLGMCICPTPGHGCKGRHGVVEDGDEEVCLSGCSCMSYSEAWLG